MRTPPEIIDSLSARWSTNSDVEAIFLFGSHASGHASESSDIDLGVVLRDGKTLDFLGLSRIDGHLIETFTGSRAFFEKFFEHFHKDNSRIGQTQFATAKLLFDRNGEGTALQAIAKEWLAKPRIKQTVEQAYWPKRVVFSSFERLERIYQSQRPDFLHAYHAFLQNTYSKYAAFLGEPPMDADRVLTYFTDPERRVQYLQQPFSDADFTMLFVAALSESNADAMLVSARCLRDHALQHMGGFQIPDRS